MTDASTAANFRVTVAFVHGAFADSSGWNDVAGQLQAAGIAVQAISNPLRGITARRRLRRQRHPADPRTGARRRSLLRRCDHHQRRTPRRQRHRPSLRRRLRPR
jgi:hypothetical protein